MHPFAMLPEGEEFAICTYLLQKYAGLTFKEATVYMHTAYSNWAHPMMEIRSPQAVYSLKKKAVAKIRKCEEPVLDMIQPYVDKAPFLLID